MGLTDSNRIADMGRQDLDKTTDVQPERDEPTVDELRDLCGFFDGMFPHKVAHIGREYWRFGASWEAPTALRLEKLYHKCRPWLWSAADELAALRERLQYAEMTIAQGDDLTAKCERLSDMLKIRTAERGVVTAQLIERTAERERDDRLYSELQSERDVWARMAGDLEAQLTKIKAQRDKAVTALREVDGGVYFALKWLDEDPNTARWHLVSVRSIVRHATEIREGERDE